MMIVLFIADLSCLKTDDLSVESDLSHFRNYLVQRNWFIVKIPSIDQVRIISRLNRTIEILFLKSTLAKTFFPFF